MATVTTPKKVIVSKRCRSKKSISRSITDFSPRTNRLSRAGLRRVKKIVHSTGETVSAKMRAPAKAKA